MVEEERRKERGGTSANRLVLFDELVKVGCRAPSASGYETAIAPALIRAHPPPHLAFLHCLRQQSMARIRDWCCLVDRWHQLRDVQIAITCQCSRLCINTTVHAFRAFG